MTVHSKTDRVERRWLRHAVASGEEGRRWAEIYDEFSEIEDLSSHAIELCRRGDPKTAEMLERTEAARRSVPAEAPVSVHALLDRWLFGMKGFVYYIDGQFDLATETIEKARTAVVTLLAEAPFLMPFANHCAEFTLHRARIERNQGHWPAMWRHVDEAAAMVDERVPLCVLPGKREIGMESIRDFFNSLELDSADQRDVSAYFDNELRMLRFQGFVRRMVAAPDFTIQYP